VSIPNLLANKRLVPELIQADATPELLSAAVLDGFDAAKRNKLETEFAALSEQLVLESGSIAATAIAEAIDRESFF
jgi:lipid-A-disaccharide synthase